jgi:RNA polymerase sigma-32 factor
MSSSARNTARKLPAYEPDALAPEERPPRVARAPRKPALRSVGVSERPSRAETPARAADPSQSALMTYLQELRRHPLMTREEEHEIAARYVETGDAALASQLVTANLRLVVKIAVEYRAAHRNLSDLVQEGNVGLIQAVQKYDPHRGVKLATYASWWIRAYILKFILSNSRLVKIGTTQAQRRLFFGVRKERARLESRGGGVAVEARHLAAAMDVSEKDVVEMERRMSASETSLDAPSRHDESGDRTCGDMLSAEALSQPDVQSENEEFRQVLQVQLQAFSATLTGRDKEIYRRRLVTDEAVTLAVIAEKFGVSRERVRQIEERLKKRLRRHLEASMGDAVSMACE